MHTVIRRYTGEGADALFTELEQREPEVRELISGVPGFISYTAFRTADGGTTVSMSGNHVYGDGTAHLSSPHVQVTSTPRARSTRASASIEPSASPSGAT